MNGIKSIIILFVLSFVSSPLFAVDQCNTTAQCREVYGNTATDCQNSQSDNSVCICGTARCDATPGTEVSIPGLIQSENYSAFFDSTSGNEGNQYRNDDVDIQTTTDNGGGYNIAWIAGNEWLEYPINITQSGSYDITTRVSSPNSDGMFTLEINGSPLGNAFAVTNTGGWQNWISLSTSSTLAEGKQTLRFQVQNGGFNINWVEFKKSGGDIPGGTLGRFDLKKDMLLANFDGKPDADDIHSVAGLGTMLLDSRFAGIKYHAVAGAVGRQGGTFINAPTLFNMAFGSNWSNANNNWDTAVSAVTNKVINIGLVA